MITNLTRAVHVIGMQAGNASAIIMELVQVHKFLGMDVKSLFTLAEEIDQSNNQLAQEVSATKSQLSQISMNMDVLATSSVDIFGKIEKVAQESKGAEGNLQKMAETSENMVRHLQDVFEQLNRSRDSTATVGKATERMVDSFDGVRRQCYVANDASDTANKATREFGTVLNELAGSAKEIGVVVDLIYDISEQTNMLALNASIEAASAGDAGKGFAVVASEIKNLAHKAVRATSNIEEKVQEIQDKSAEASSVADKVFELVARIYEVNLGIAHAIDDQRESTQRVSQSMGQVRDAMDTIMQSAQKLESATKSVAAEAAGGAASVAEISAQASHVSETAGDMDRQTREARQFAVATYDSAKKTDDLSRRVKEKLEVSFRMTRFLSGSVNHFGLLSSVSRETNDSFHDNLQAFKGFSEPFEMFRFKSDTLSMMGQLEKAAFGSVKLKSHAFASWEQSEVGKWVLENQDTPFKEEPLFSGIKKSCQAMHESASQVIVHLSGKEAALAKEAMQAVHTQRRKMFAAMDGLYLVPLSFKPKRTDLVEWKHTLDTGVPEIDKDHRTLFAMLNIVHNAIYYPEEMGIQKNIFRDMFQFAKEHFDREERLMEQSNYPKSEGHRAQHLVFLGQAEKFSGLMDEKSHTLLLDLSIFVKNWFSFHISKWDQEMGHHLSGKKTR